MADPRFFKRAAAISLGELAVRCGAELAEGGDPDRTFQDVAALGSAGPTELSFLDNRKYVPALAESKAGACFLRPELANHAPAGMQLLLTKNPYKAFALAAHAFYPPAPVEPAIAPSAVIDDSAVLGQGVRVDPGAVIGARAEVGDRCWIGANAVVGEAVRIGEDSIVGANVTLSHCLIGARVHLLPGAVIGQRGFGFAIDPAGHVEIPQLGRVIIEDDVEVGANTAIDRGAGPDTVIGAGTKIDNLVQIGHNLRLGRGCLIAAQVGMAGSSTLGDMVIMGGQGGVGGHLKIGSGVQIAAQSGILKDLDPGERVMGTPARPIKQFFREVVTLEKLSKKTKSSE